MSHAKETLTRNTALQPEPVKPEITLGDEEVSDVSLATFHVVDKENGKTPAVAPVVAVVVVAVTAAAAEVGPTDCVPIPSMLRVSGGAIVVAGEVRPVARRSPAQRSTRSGRSAHPAARSALLVAFAISSRAHSPPHCAQ